MTWVPMTRRMINPQAAVNSQKVGDLPMDEAWANPEYDCQVRYLEERGRGGMLHLSIKRLDRDASHDWRRLQSIKNEVAGWEREAIELYPAESRLVDGANQTHLWVLPAGDRLPLGFKDRAVGTHKQMEAELRRHGVGPGKARQRDWEDGLSTGPEFARKVGL